MNQKRIQLTLFIEPTESERIERIRMAFNMEQFQLIACHVTLCREDELDQIDKIIENLSRSGHRRISIAFGDAVRYAVGKGVMLPGFGKNEAFQQLRQAILSGVYENPRNHEPHINLMHPRNAACTDDAFELIRKVEFPRRITFRKINLIEQEAGNKWEMLKEFDLR